MKENFDNTISGFPRERILKFGPESLSDTELLALVLGSGGRDMSVFKLSNYILRECSGLYGLSQISATKLQNLKYIGTAKTACLLSLTELALRITTPVRDIQQLITAPEHVFNLLRKDLFAKKRELLYLLSLDGRNKLIAKDLISLGTIDSTLVSPREVFRQALLRNATSAVLAHNHPSQNLTPSTEDLILTEEVAKIGVSLGIPLLDHVIITDSSYTSIKALNLFDLTSKGGEKK
jgi:DNA repair protein RadC